MSLENGLDLHFGLTRRSTGGVSFVYLDEKILLICYQRLSFSYQDDVIDFYDALQNCAICLLESGELAIVPGDAQPGDVICIISGTTAPCVLRPDRDGCWILVSGDCHILDMGAIDVAGIRDYVSMNLSSVQKFIIR